MAADAAAADAAAAGVAGRDDVRLGVGVGWRHELEVSIERLAGIDFVEVLAESVNPHRLPSSLRLLRDAGKPVVVHGIGLSLGGAEPPAGARLRRLARLCDALGAPMVSEHLAFVRAGGLESGHLLPVPRNSDALDVVCANIELAQSALPVPLVLENVAAIFEWPNPEMSEGEFLRRLVDRTGVMLLVDVANLYANQRNFESDARETLATLPLDQIGYVHIAGGVQKNAIYHDTHAHPFPDAVLDLLKELCRRCTPSGVLLEYDGGFPTDQRLTSELATIAQVMYDPYV